MKKMLTNQSILTGAVIIILALIFPVLIYAGSLNPPGPPASTMKTMEQVPPIWSQQIQCDTNACPRFVEVLLLQNVVPLEFEGVLDRETGLVWEKSPSLIQNDWFSAIDHCYDLSKGGRMGWHLPTLEQLTSLVDRSLSNPSLPGGHPFSNIRFNGPFDKYWSATTYVNDSNMAFTVRFKNGSVYRLSKTADLDMYAWCVRGGQSHDSY